MGKSLKMTFLVSIVVLSVVLLGILTFFNTRNVSTNMESGVMSTLQEKAAYDADVVEKRMTNVAGKTESLGRMLASMQNYDIELTYAYIRNFVASDPIICGSGLWFAPNAYPGGEKWFGPYIFKGDNNKIELTMDYSNEEYNYPQFAWYKESIKGADQVFWDEPAYDPVERHVHRRGLPERRAGDRDREGQNCAREHHPDARPEPDREGIRGAGASVSGGKELSARDGCGNV